MIQLKLNVILMAILLAPVVPCGAVLNRINVSVISDNVRSKRRMRERYIRGKVKVRRVNLRLVACCGLLAGNPDTSRVSRQTFATLLGFARARYPFVFWIFFAPSYTTYIFFAFSRP